jgi:hypothetical protein
MKRKSLRDSIMLHDVPRTSVLGLKFLHFSKAEAAPVPLQCYASD